MSYAPCEKLDETTDLKTVSGNGPCGDESVKCSHLAPRDDCPLAEREAYTCPPEEECPEVVERLEQLDDVIFPAIDGDEAALEASEPVWRETVAELGPEVIEESRSEYLRYARSVWQFLSSQAITQPLRLLAVMKIIGLLMGDDV